MGIRFLLYFALGLFALGIISFDGVLIGLSLLPFTLFWLSYSASITPVELSLTPVHKRLFSKQRYKLHLKLKHSNGSHFLGLDTPKQLEELSQSSFYINESADYELEASFQSGQVHWPVAHCLSSNALAWRWLEFVKPVNLQFQVAPKVQQAVRYIPNAKQTFGFAGPIKSNQAGSSTEPFGIGDYQPGKSIRHINWRKSAKFTDKLFINEYIAEQHSNMTFLLDARTSSNTHPFEAIIDYSKGALFALAKSFNRDGHRLNFHLFGHSWQQQKGHSGQAMLLKLEQQLHHCQLGSSRLWPKLSQNLAKFVPVGSSLVIISPLSFEDLPLYRAIKAMGYECLVIAPDPTSVLANWLEFSPAVELCLQSQQAVRQQLLNQLHALQIDVIDWQLNQPLNQAMLQHQPIRRRK